MSHARRDADARMAADGFRPRWRTGDVALDRQLASGLQCQKCGNLGHELRAFERDGRYRALTICRGCKDIQEL